MKTLKRELRAAGASADEVQELAALVGKLRHLNKVEVPSRASSWRRSFSFGVTAVAGLVLGALLMVYAQSTLPGSWLYPLQKVSDAVMVHAQPQYRANVMMKRAAQVKQLVAQHAGRQTVLATLGDYQSEAAAYKTMRTNYAAFEYCESNLRQAAVAASPAERSAIEHTLHELSDTNG